MWLQDICLRTTLGPFEGLYLRLHSYPPPPKSWFFLVFHEKEPLLFFRWVVLVRHFVRLKGILVQDSFAEKDPYGRSLVKYVGKTCSTWK
jgi:hypothetical protein